MADLSKTIQIVFEGVDKVGPGLTSMGRGLDSFATKARDVTQPLADITKGILAMDAAAAGLAVVIGTRAVQEANKMEDALAGVGKQLQDGDPPLVVARDRIEELALKYGESGVIMTNSTASFLAAGNDLATSLSLVETATKLMIGGDLDAVKATETITKSLAGFAIPANEAAAGATRVADILNKLADISSGKPDELADGFARLAPTAQAAGLSMEETGAVVAVLVDKFGEGNMSATSFKSGLLSLMDPSKEGGKELERLSVNVKDSNGVLRLGGDIMKDLSAATSKQTANQQLQSAAIIFGKEQAGTMNALLSNWSKYQSYVTQELDKTTGAVGSLDREMAVKMALMSTHIDRTTEAWRQFNTALGDEIKGKGELNGLVDAWGRLALAAKDALGSDSMDPLFSVLSSHFDALGKYIDGIVKALPDAMKGLDWSPVLKALGDVETGFGSLFSGLDLTKPEDLHKALQGVVDTIGRFIGVTEGIVNGLKPLFTIIGTVAGAFSELSPEVQSTVGYILGIGTTINLVAGPIGTLGTAIKGLGGIVVESGGAIAGLASKLGVGGALVAGAGAAGYAVGTVLNDGISKVIETATGTKGQTLGGWLYDITHSAENLAITAPTAADGMGKLADATFKTGGTMEDMVPTVDMLDDAQRRALLTTNDITAQYNLLAGDALPKAGEAATITSKALSDMGFAVTTGVDGVTKYVRVNGEWLEQSTELNSALETNKDSIEKAAKANLDYSATSESVRLAIDNETKSLIEVSSKSLELDRGYTDLVKINGEWVNVIEATNKENELLLFSNDKVVKGIGQSVAATNENIESRKIDSSIVSEFIYKNGALVEITGKSAAALDAEAKASKEAADATAKKAKETEALNKVTTEFMLGWEKIQSAQRVAIFDIQSKVNIAKIEADAKRTVAAYTSIGEAFKSTETVLGKLLDLWGSAKSGSDKNSINAWIEREYRIRETLAKSQQDLIVAEIKRMDAQTQLARQGGMDVKITADGLEPDLQAFMFRVIDKVRVSVAGTYQDFLLGCGGATP